MFFTLSKILGFVALPSNVMMLMGLLGAALLLTRHRRLALRMMTASLLALAAAGWSPMGNWLMAPLENRFPAWVGTGAPDGVIILGGAISPELSRARGSVALNEAAERVTAAADLARRYPAAQIVFSGAAAVCLAVPPRPISCCHCSKVSASRASASPWKAARATPQKTRV